MKLLDSAKVSFVCPRCQRIYYQSAMDDYNSNPGKVVKEARVYKRHYHSCHIKRRS